MPVCKYAKIFYDNFWLIFTPTEYLGDPFLVILCLLKILATHSSWFYAYWRSWWPILADFMPTEDLGDSMATNSFLFHSNFQKLSFLLCSKKDHARVCQFGDWWNGVDMKWYDYMKCNKEINYIFLKEKENYRLKVRIINVGVGILLYKHTTDQNIYTYVGVVR